MNFLLLVYWCIGILVIRGIKGFRGFRKDMGKTIKPLRNISVKDYLVISMKWGVWSG